MTLQRPTGVSVIAVLLVIGGVLSLIGAILAIVALGTGNLAGGVGSAALVFSLIIAALDFALAYGLWTLQRWAFWGVVVLEILALINVFAIHAGSSWLGIIFPTVVLIYMFGDGNVRRAFHIGM